MRNLEWFDGSPDKLEPGMFFQHKDYEGGFLIGHGKAVDMFNACHGTQLTEEQGWHLMELVKHVRYFTAPGYHADSVEDGAAYAALRGEAGAAKAHEPASEIDDESERIQAIGQNGNTAEHYAE